MNKYDIEDWITFVKRLEEKNLKTPFHSFFLQFAAELMLYIM